MIARTNIYNRSMLPGKEDFIRNQFLLEMLLVGTLEPIKLISIFQYSKSPFKKDGSAPPF